MHHEIAVEVLDKNYVDQLIVALARQGLEVYFNETENRVCFVAYEGVTQINGRS